jgi:GNAT superfamily N-acetyltransferase
VSGEVTIRRARAGDGASLADAWIEFGREYAGLDPVHFMVPEEHEEWVESDLNTERSDDEAWLVAERDERVIGYVQAKIDRPAEDSDRQLLRDLREPILKVTALLVVEEQRRRGVGTALMRAVERWAKSRGATRAFLTTYRGSPTAVPFYEKRMGYRPKVLGFWKEL